MCHFEDVPIFPVQTTSGPTHYPGQHEPGPICRTPEAVACDVFKNMSRTRHKILIS